MSFERAKKVCSLIVGLALISYLSGCTYHFTKSSYMSDMKSDSSILVYGYFDDADAPFTMKQASLYDEPFTSDKPLRLRSDNKGLFYLENIPMGSYRLKTFEGPAKGLSSEFLVMPIWGEYGRPGFERAELTARKPGIYYLGSYKMRKVKKGGLFEEDTYDVVGIQGPSEQEMLTKLLKYAKGTKWQGQIEKRLMQLGGTKQKN